jgi:hypothetical protein
MGVRYTRGNCNQDLIQKTNVFSPPQKHKESGGTVARISSQAPFWYPASAVRKLGNDVVAWTSLNPFRQDGEPRCCAFLGAAISSHLIDWRETLNVRDVNDVMQTY